MQQLQMVAVVPIVGLLFDRIYTLHETVPRALVKLGKDWPTCKMEMVKTGAFESTLSILHEAQDFLYIAFVELPWILANNATIA